ncbi:MAG: hypothetical protein AB4060_14380 [Crocosphaera sp.]
MTKNNPHLDMEKFIIPLQCLNDIVTSYTEYLKIKEQEKTKRHEITTKEKITIAEIQAKRDLLINYLEFSFDERAKNFNSLFQLVDQAIDNEDNQQLSLALQGIIALAQSSPFDGLTDLSQVKAALDDPDHIWEL